MSGVFSTICQSPCARGPEDGNPYVVKVWRQVPPHMWCVTRECLRQLRKEVKDAISDGKLRPPSKDSRFYNAEYDSVELDKWDPTVYMVMDKVVKPKLTPTSSWALDKNPDGLHCHVFVTHAWAEGFFEFVEAAMKSFPWPCKHMYVCFLGNPQDEDSLIELMSEGASKSPFYQALKKATWFVVIPTKRICIYERLWCVFEMYHAQLRVHREKDLKIRMSTLTNKQAVLTTSLVILFVLVCPVSALSYCVLAPVVGRYFGPITWLSLLHTLGASVSVIIQQFSKCFFHHERRHEMPQMEISVLKYVTYAQLFFFGIGSGCSAWDFFNEHDDKDTVMTRVFSSIDDKMPDAKGNYVGFRWEHGEFFSCSLFFVSYFLSYVYDLVIYAMCQAIHDEGGKLNHFTTVTNATCFSEADKKMIMEDIGDDIDRIDQGIRALRTIGKYDDEVLFNLRLGMPQKTIRRGINPFQILCAVCTWEFWLLTDLQGLAHGSLSVKIFLVTCVAGLLLVYGPRTYKFRALVPNEKFIFAISSLSWVGLAFVALSNHPNWFSRDAVEKRYMSAKTLPLLIPMVCVWVCLNLMFYSGCWGSFKKKCKGRRSFHDEQQHETKGSFAGMKAVSSRELSLNISRSRETQSKRTFSRVPQNEE